MQRDLSLVKSLPVELAGDIHGAYLSLENGTWTWLALLFRVSVSSYGSGTTLVLLGPPGQVPTMRSGGLCISDNAGLAYFLTKRFLRNWAPMSTHPALAKLVPSTGYSFQTVAEQGRRLEIIRSDNATVELKWSNVQPALAFEVGSGLAPTGRHESVGIVQCALMAEIYLNSERLQGEVGRHPMFGLDASSAFLSFSGIWMGAAATDDGEVTS